MDIERLMLKSRGLAINDSEAQPDMGRLRAYRLGRIQAEVRAGSGRSAALRFGQYPLRERHLQRADLQFPHAFPRALRPTRGQMRAL